MSASDYDLELEEAERRAVGRLLTSDVFDGPAFENLYQLLCRKAETLKQEHVVSKQLLHCLLSAEQAIRSRAEYIPTVKAQLNWAERFSLLLHHIAIGEGCNDRSSGAPRVV